MDPLTDGEKQVLRNIHEAFYKGRLIDSPQMAQLGLQYSALLEKLFNAKPKEEGKPSA